jgi:ectoine hydroxylase-related dioxygenase (phytanoyl-CoA dioxygenase family)
MELLALCGNDFELFAKKTQYDEIFIKRLRSKSKSLEMNYGDFVIFDPRCLHCTQYNDTKDTRISMDIRIILEGDTEKYSKQYRTTGRKKMPFLPGHYFSKKSV